MRQTKNFATLNQVHLKIRFHLDTLKVPTVEDNFIKPNIIWQLEISTAIIPLRNI